MKKLMALLLATLMVMSVFVGCGPQNPTEPSNGKPVDATGDEEKPAVDGPKELVEFSMLYCENGNQPFKEDWLIHDLLAEHAGVKLNVQAVPASDFETKKQIVLGSGDIPDIVAHTFASGDDALSGLLLPISDYMDQMPNFTKFIEDNGLTESLDNSRMSDGKFYTLPVKAMSAPVQDHQWIIRKDILDKHGLEMPETMEELLEVATKLKELYPDSTPIGNRFGAANIFAGIAGGYGTIAGWTFGDGMYFDRDSNEWRFAPVTDAWKDMVTMGNKLYTSGALDIEFNTLDTAVFEQNITNDKIFISYDWASNCKGMNTRAHEAGNTDFNMVPMFPPEGYEGKYALQWCGFNQQGWVFPATVAEKDYFEDLLKFIDWCYTEEAATILTFGKEGVTYNLNENGEKVWIDDTIDNCAVYGVFNNELNVRLDLDIYYANDTEETAAVHKKCAEMKAVPIPNPASPLSADENEMLAVTVQGLIDHCNSNMLKFIDGSRPLTEWDAFVQECVDKGYEKLENAYREAAK